jgi:hypothetical protein
MSGRTVELRIRVTPAEREGLTAKARLNHQTLSDFLREAINEIVADLDDGTAILRTRERISSDCSAPEVTTP